MTPEQLAAHLEAMRRHAVERPPRREPVDQGEQLTLPGAPS